MKTANVSMFKTGDRARPAFPYSSLIEKPDANVERYKVYESKGSRYRIYDKYDDAKDAFDAVVLIGGKSFVKKAIYLTSARIELDSYVNLEGETLATKEGNETVIKGSNGIFNIDQKYRIKLKNLVLHGNNGSSDVLTASKCPYPSVFEDVTIKSSTGNGIYAEECHDWMLNRVSFEYLSSAANKAAILLRRPASPVGSGKCADWYMNRLRMESINGMCIDAYDPAGDVVGNWRILDGKFEGAFTKTAIKMKGGDLGFRGNYITEAQKENLVIDCDYFRILDIHCLNDDTQDVTKPDILINGGRGVISGGTFIKETGTAHIELGAGVANADLISISDLSFYSSPAKPYILNNAASGKPSIVNLVGSEGRSENAGSSTGTGAQQTIPHGVADTPTVVILWNIQDGANPYQSAAADATNIYITAVLNQDYGWEASI